MAEAVYGSQFGYPLRGAVLTNVRCNGSEFSLSNCEADGPRDLQFDSYCGSGQFSSAGVRCIESK